MASAPHEKICVALDVPERETAVALAKSLRDHVGMVKIGLEGFVAHGPDLVREIIDAGLEVFLDLKVHDIPRTAAAAAAAASGLGAKLLTIHAAGGAPMVAAAKDAAGPDLNIIAVTMLTSLDDALVTEMGYGGGVRESAVKLATVALGNGADGLVCSAHELDVLSTLGGKRVVPGVRPVGSAAGDQRRVATPAEAVAKGATWIVVGRPIIQAEDPVAAAKAIAAELPA